ncbi:ABC transporter ATP-binding protein [Candidatus Latescibacterota bacterium]
MVSMEHLTKVFGDHVAVDHLSLEIDAGEVFSLLGANGAGKTTTINLLLNFTDPTSGEARINDLDVVRDAKEVKRHVAYLSENVMLYGNMTARQNLDFFVHLSGREGIDPEEYDPVMRRVGLPERAFDARVKTFSKGMRQRLGIASVILKRAPVVIMDEPMSGLDPRGAEDFTVLLRELRDDGCSILMSTHDVFRASDVSDRVGIMKEGRLIMVRAAEELVDQDLRHIYLDYMKN